MAIKFLSQFITKRKGEAWNFDPHIPDSYIFGFLLEKVIMLLRGYFFFGDFRKLCFVGSGTSIKCRRKIKYTDNLSIARYCYLDALSINGIVFGKNVSLGKYTTIECTGSLKDIGIGLKVGDNVGLGSHGFFGCAGGVEIGNDTILGNFVSFHSENHVIDDLNIPIRQQGVIRKGIKIGKNCWLGSKVTILDGVEMGDGCVIAAGAVVKAGIYQPNQILGGIPAKIIKTRI